MKTFKKALFIVLLGFTIYLCFRNYKLSREVDSLKLAVNEIPDTVYTEKPFKPEKKYSEKVEPGKILVHDNKQPTLFPDSMLRQPVISDQDSLVQIVLKKDKLNLSLFNKETNTYSTRLFPIDLYKYNYNWYEGQLTRKKVARLSLSPYPARSSTLHCPAACASPCCRWRCRVSSCPRTLATSPRASCWSASASSAASLSQRRR